VRLEEKKTLCDELPGMGTARNLRGMGILAPNA
jgi:hypothetical protein